METLASHPPTLFDATVISPDNWVDRAEAEGRYLRIPQWTSALLPTPRDLFLYLPVAYVTQPHRRFPVLLMHDGQNLFDGDLSYVHGSTWQVGYTADKEAAAGRAEPVIILGIANTGVHRMAEYTPTADKRLGGGLGPTYARMLVDELLPWLRSTYRTLPGAHHTGIAGSSLGGLISLATALRYPHIFGQVGVLSPSIWWDNRSILRDVRSLHDHLDLRIWLDMGAAEGQKHLRDADLLAKLLGERGWRPGADLLYRNFPEAHHNEAAWAARFPQVLRYLFPAT